MIHPQRADHLNKWSTFNKKKLDLVATRYCKEKKEKNGKQNQNAEHKAYIQSWTPPLSLHNHRKSKK